MLLINYLPTMARTHQSSWRLVAFLIALLGLTSSTHGLFYTGSDKGGVPKIGRRSGSLSYVGRNYKHSHSPSHPSNSKTPPAETFRKNILDFNSLAEILDSKIQAASFVKSAHKVKPLRNKMERKSNELNGEIAVPSEDIWRWLIEGVPTHQRRYGWRDQIDQGAREEDYGDSVEDARSEDARSDSVPWE